MDSTQQLYIKSLWFQIFLPTFTSLITLPMLLQCCWPKCVAQLAVAQLCRPIVCRPVGLSPRWPYTHFTRCKCFRFCSNDLPTIESDDNFFSNFLMNTYFSLSYLTDIKYNTVTKLDHMLNLWLIELIACGGGRILIRMLYKLCYELLLTNVLLYFNLCSVWVVHVNF